MHRRSILLAATALFAAGAFAQPAPMPPVSPPPSETDKKADPLQPQKAEQEPRPIQQELQKQARQLPDSKAAALLFPPPRARW